jgi:cytochrome c5
MLISGQGALLEAAKKGQAGAVQGNPIAQGRIIFGESCIQCHDMNIVLIQRKPVAGWKQTVYSMISRGAEVTANEIEPLVAYLAATYGPDSPSPRAGSKSEIGDEAGLPAGAGKQILSHACVRCHKLSLVMAARKSKAEWEAAVARMVSLGAALSSAEQQTLTQYLAQNLSNKK